MALSINILERFQVIPKSKGKYHAFPTAIQVGDRLWLGCRSGETDETQPHGRSGTVILCSADIHHPSEWTDHGVVFGQGEGEGYELDALLSGPFDDGNITLVTREFSSGKFNRSYITHLHMDDLLQIARGGMPALKRTLLSDVGITPSACFGHVVGTADGALLMPGYAWKANAGCSSPWLWESTDNGRHWCTRAVVADSDAAGKELNEHTVVPLGEGKWLTLIRDNQAPSVIWQSESRDNGRTWSDLKDSGLLGHAPVMWLDNEYNRIMVIYRNLAEAVPEIAIACSHDQGQTWQKLVCLTTYSGGLYNGGYGDVLGIGDNRYLAVYYVSDEDASPWVEGAVFEVKD